METIIDINSNTNFKELIYINFPSELDLELDSKYSIINYYSIDWDRLIDKTFLDITKLRIPLVLLGNKNNFITQEKNLINCENLDLILSANPNPDDNIVLLLNLGTSKKKFNHQKSFFSRN